MKSLFWLAMRSWLFCTLALSGCVGQKMAQESSALGAKGPLCGSLKPKLLEKSGSSTFESSLQFGTEIEFPLRDVLHKQDSLERYRETLAQICRQCEQVSKLETCQMDGGVLRIRASGKQLTILSDIDPGVLEIKTLPLTYGETAAWAGIIDTFIFGAAKAMGEEILDPSIERNRWSGHVNVSWADLRRDGELASKDPAIAQTMRLFLNFYVDLQNHPEMGMGVLGGDTRNATPLAFGDEEERGRLTTIVNRMREGAYQSIFDVGLALTAPTAWSFADRYKTQGRNHRYNMINTENIGTRWNKQNGSRLEIRSFFTPRNADDMLANYRIVTKRLLYLQSKDHVIPYNGQRFMRSSYRTHGLQPGITIDEAADSYISYLRGTGLDPRKEAPYLRDPEIQRAVLKRTRGCF